MPHSEAGEFFLHQLQPFQSNSLISSLSQQESLSSKFINIIKKKQENKIFSFVTGETDTLFIDALLECSYLQNNQQSKNFTQTPQKPVDMVFTVPNDYKVNQDEETQRKKKIIQETIANDQRNVPNHSEFFLPKLEGFSNYTYMIEYGKIPEIIILFKKRQDIPRNSRLTATELSQMEHFFGKTIKFAGKGLDLQMDRLFLLEKMKILMKNHNEVIEYIEIHLPCDLLHHNSFLITNDIVHDRLNVFQKINFVICISVSIMTLPVPFQQFLLTSGFLFKFIRNPKEFPIVFLFPTSQLIGYNASQEEPLFFDWKNSFRNQFFDMLKKVNQISTQNQLLTNFLQFIPVDYEFYLGLHLSKDTNQFKLSKTGVPEFICNFSNYQLNSLCDSMEKLNLQWESDHKPTEFQENQKIIEILIHLKEKLGQLKLTEDKIEKNVIKYMQEKLIKSTGLLHKNWRQYRDTTLLSNNNQQQISLEFYKNLFKNGNNDKITIFEDFIAHNLFDLSFSNFALLIENEIKLIIEKVKKIDEFHWRQIKTLSKNSSNKNRAVGAVDNQITIEDEDEKFLEFIQLIKSKTQSKIQLIVKGFEDFNYKKIIFDLIKLNSKEIFIPFFRQFSTNPNSFTTVEEIDNFIVKILINIYQKSSNELSNKFVAIFAKISSFLKIFEKYLFNLFDSQVKIFDFSSTTCGPLEHAKLAEEGELRSYQLKFYFWLLTNPLIKSLSFHSDKNLFLLSPNLFSNLAKGPSGCLVPPPWFILNQFLQNSLPNTSSIQPAVSDKNDILLLTQLKNNLESLHLKLIINNEVAPDLLNIHQCALNFNDLQISNSLFKTLSYLTYGMDELFPIIRMLLFKEISDKLSIYFPSSNSCSSAPVLSQEYLYLLANCNLPGDFICLFAYVNYFHVNILLFSPIVNHPILISPFDQDAVDASAQVVSVIYYKSLFFPLTTPYQSKLLNDPPSVDDIAYDASKLPDECDDTPSIDPPVPNNLASTGNRPKAERKDEDITITNDDVIARPSLVINPKSAPTTSNLIGQNALTHTAPIILSALPPPVAAPSIPTPIIRTPLSPVKIPSQPLFQHIEPAKEEVVIDVRTPNNVIELHDSDTETDSELEMEIDDTEESTNIFLTVSDDEGDVTPAQAPDSKPTKKRKRELEETNEMEIEPATKFSKNEKEEKQSKPTVKIPKLKNILITKIIENIDLLPSLDGRIPVDLVLTLFSNLLQQNKLTVKITKKLFSNCKIDCLDVSHSTGISEEILKTITDSSCIDSLKELNISFSKLITSTGLVYLLEKCKNQLVKLNVSHTNIHENVFLSIVTSQNQLKRLNMNHCKSLNDELFKNILLNCKNIEKLNFTSCQNLSANPFRFLKNFFFSNLFLEKLEKLNLENLPQMNNLALENLFDNLHSSKLKIIKISAMESVHENSLKKLILEPARDGMLNNLTELSIPNAYLPPDFFLVLLGKYGNFNLKKLNLAECKNMSPDLFQFSPDSPAISLGDCFSPTKKVLYQFSKPGKYFYNLENLNFSKIESLDDNLLMKFLPLCKKPFKKLNFNFSEKITDASLSQWMVFCNFSLETLQISNCSNISDNFLSYLMNFCKNIKKLNFANLNLISSNSLMKLVHSLHKIQFLNLSCCDKMQSDFFQFLSNYSKNFVSLNFQELKITDEELIKIIKLSRNSLKYLNISYCPNITDQAILKIGKYCKNLISVDFSFLNSSISFQTIKSSLENWKDLKSLSLRGFSSSIDSGFSHSALSNLDLSWSNHVTDSAVTEILFHCPQLIALNLTRCSKITQAAVIPILRGNVSIQYLVIKSCNSIPVTIQNILSSALPFPSSFKYH